MKKTCTRCNTNKLFTDFHKRSRNTDGLEGWCKVCMLETRKTHYEKNKDWYKERQARLYQENKEKVNARSKERYLKRVFNLTVEQYQEIVDKSINCPLCYSLFTDKNKPCLDHCHTTGKLREPLCRQCNLVLGLVKDDSTLLERAINYLKRNA